MKLLPRLLIVVVAISLVSLTVALAASHKARPHHSATKIQTLNRIGSVITGP